MCGDDGYDLWQASDFVQIDTAKNRTRYLDTNVCWTVESGRRRKERLRKYKYYDSDTLAQITVSDGYLYIPCGDWQQSRVYVYDRQAGRGQRRYPLRTMRPPEILDPTGVAVGS